MKLITALPFLVLSIYSNAQQVSNGNFESWGLNEIPTNWACGNTEELNLR